MDESPTSLVSGGSEGSPDDGSPFPRTALFLSPTFSEDIFQVSDEKPSQLQKSFSFSPAPESLEANPHKQGPLTPSLSTKLRPHYQTDNLPSYIGPAGKAKHAPLQSNMGRSEGLIRQQGKSPQRSSSAGWPSGLLEPYSLPPAAMQYDLEGLATGVTQDRRRMLQSWPEIEEVAASGYGAVLDPSPLGSSATNSSGISQVSDDLRCYRSNTGAQPVRSVRVHPTKSTRAVVKAKSKQSPLEALLARYRLRGAKAGKAKEVDQREEPFWDKPIPKTRKMEGADSWRDRYASTWLVGGGSKKAEERSSEKEAEVKGGSTSRGNVSAPGSASSAITFDSTLSTLQTSPPDSGGVSFSSHLTLRPNSRPSSRPSSRPVTPPPLSPQKSSGPQLLFSEVGTSGFPAPSHPPPPVPGPTLPRQISPPASTAAKADDPVGVSSGLRGINGTQILQGMKIPGVETFEEAQAEYETLLGGCFPTSSRASPVHASALPPHSPQSGRAGGSSQASEIASSDVEDEAEETGLFRPFMGFPVLESSSEAGGEATPDEVSEMASGGLVYGVPATDQGMGGQPQQPQPVVLTHGALVSLMSNGKRLGAVRFNGSWQLGHPPHSSWDDSADVAAADAQLHGLGRWPLDSLFILLSTGNGFVGLRSIVAEGRTLTASDPRGGGECFVGWEFQEAQMFRALPPVPGGSGGWSKELNGVSEGPLLLTSIKHPSRSLSVVLLGLMAKSLSGWRHLEGQALATPILRHQVRQLRAKVRELGRQRPTWTLGSTQETARVLADLQEQVKYLERELQKAVAEAEQARAAARKPVGASLVWNRKIGRGTGAVLELERRLNVAEDEAEELRERVQQLEAVAREAEMLREHVRFMQELEADVQGAAAAPRSRSTGVSPRRSPSPPPSYGRGPEGKNPGKGSEGAAAELPGPSSGLEGKQLRRAASADLGQLSRTPSTNSEGRSFSGGTPPGSPQPAWLTGTMNEDEEEVGLQVPESLGMGPLLRRRFVRGVRRPQQSQRASDEITAVTGQTAGEDTSGPGGPEPAPVEDVAEAQQGSNAEVAVELAREAEDGGKPLDPQVPRERPAGQEKQREQGEKDPKQRPRARWNVASQSQPADGDASQAAGQSWLNINWAEKPEGEQDRAQELLTNGIANADISIGEASGTDSSAGYTPNAAALAQENPDPSASLEGVSGPREAATPDADRNDKGTGEKLPSDAASGFLAASSMLKSKSGGSLSRDMALERGEAKTSERPKWGVSLAAGTAGKRTGSHNKLMQLLAANRMAAGSESEDSPPQKLSSRAAVVGSMLGGEKGRGAEGGSPSKGVQPRVLKVGPQKVGYAGYGAVAKPESGRAEEHPGKLGATDTMPPGNQAGPGQQLKQTVRETVAFNKGGSSPEVAPSAAQSSGPKDSLSRISQTVTDGKAVVSAQKLQQRALRDPVHAEPGPGPAVAAAAAAQPPGRSPQKVRPAARAEEQSSKRAPSPTTRAAVPSAKKKAVATGGGLTLTAISPQAPAGSRSPRKAPARKPEPFSFGTPASGTPSRPAWGTGAATRSPSPHRLPLETTQPPAVTVGRKGGTDALEVAAAVKSGAEPSTARQEKISSQSQAASSAAGEQAQAGSSSSLKRRVTALRERVSALRGSAAAAASTSAPPQSPTKGAAAGRAAEGRGGDRGTPKVKPFLTGVARSRVDQGIGSVGLPDLPSRSSNSLQKRAVSPTASPRVSPTVSPAVSPRKAPLARSSPGSCHQSADAAAKAPGSTVQAGPLSPRAKHTTEQPPIRETAVSRASAAKALMSLPQAAMAPGTPGKAGVAVKEAEKREQGMSGRGAGEHPGEGDRAVRLNSQPSLGVRSLTPPPQRVGEPAGFRQSPKAGALGTEALLPASYGNLCSETRAEHGRARDSVHTIGQKASHGRPSVAVEGAKGSQGAGGKWGVRGQENEHKRAGDKAHAEGRRSPLRDLQKERPGTAAGIRATAQMRVLGTRRVTASPQLAGSRNGRHGLSF